MGKIKVSRFVHIIFIVMMVCSNAYSQTKIFATQFGAGQMDGSNWANALSQHLFRAALNNAVSGDSFCLAEGVYKPYPHADSSYVIKKGVKVFGGFPSTGNPNFESRNPAVNKTIFDGDVLGNDAVGLIHAELNLHPTRMDNNINLLVFEASDSSTLLDGVVLKNGRSHEVMVISGQPIIRNCQLLFAGNYAMVVLVAGSIRSFNCLFAQSVRAILANGGIELNQCTIKDNSPSGLLINHGAVFVNQTNATFYQCSFINNRAVAGFSVSGGAVYGGGKLNFRYCQFKNNLANTISGGAVVSTNCDFYSCQFDSAGGSLSVSGVLDSCVFMERSNSIYGNNLTIKNCEFIKANGFIEGIDINIVNSKFIERTGTINALNAKIENCLFERNSAPANGFIVKGDISQTIFRKNNGLCIGGGSVRFCLFEENTGAGVSFYGQSSGTIANCRFTKCSRPIYIKDLGSGSQLYQISNCIFDSCYSDSSGGAIYFASNQLNLESCGFFHNKAVKNGGALCALGLVSINNCVFAKNTSMNGAAAWFDYRYNPPFVGNINQSTFYGNESSSMGGAVYVQYNLSKPQLHLNHSVFWNNKNKGVSNFLHADSAIGSINRSVVQQQFPLLSAGFVRNNNDEFYPMFFDTNSFAGMDGAYGTWDDGLSLLVCSPAINRGDKLSYPTHGTLDFTGSTRIRGADIDLGAYEFQSDSIPFQGPNLIQPKLLNNGICANETLVLKTDANPLRPGYYVHWYRNDKLFAFTKDSIVRFAGTHFQNGDTLYCRYVLHPNCLAPDSNHSEILVLKPYPRLEKIVGNKEVFYSSEETYSVDSQAMVTYNWSVSNGVIFSGFGTHQIKVKWDSVFTSGFIKVVTQNANPCSDSLKIVINGVPNTMSLMPDTIFGKSLGDTIPLLFQSSISGKLLSKDFWIKLSSYDFLGTGQVNVFLEKNGQSTRKGMIIGQSGSLFDTVYVLQESSIGLNEMSFSPENVKVFPNPTSSNFAIQFYGDVAYPIQWVLYDMEGRIIQQHKITTIEPNPFNLNVDLRSGIYLLKFTNSMDQSQTIRLVINK